MRHLKNHKKRIKKHLTLIKNPYFILTTVLILMLFLLTLQNIHLYSIVSDLSKTNQDDFSYNLSETINPTSSEILNIDKNIDQPFGDIINKVNAHKILDDYSLYDTIVEPIAQDDLESYAKEKPVIYGNLSGDNLYQLQYVSDDGGYLIIYDSKTDEILKIFKTSMMSLS